MQDLSVPAGQTESAAQGVSADGLTLFGGGSALFRWTTGGGWDSPAVLAGFPQFDYFVLGSSGDGSVIVGGTFDTNGLLPNNGFVWTSTLGMLNTSDFLTANGASLAGWTELAALDVADNGATFVGAGYLNGQFNYWLVTIPGPSTLGALVLAMAGCARRHR